VLQLPVAQDDEKSLSEELAVVKAEKSFLLFLEPHLGQVTSSCFSEDL
jgi:hypothetical protein